MTEISDKAREEFFSEAQELIENLSRNLLALDAAQKAGASDPSLINEAFRAVHTLKGLAGLFGATQVGALSHRLEDLLDDIRLGRQPLTPELLDVFFSSVDVFTRVLAAERELCDEPVPALGELMARLDQFVAQVPMAASPADEYDLDPGMLAVLTEYEEHRLRVNIEQGLRLYRLRVQFDLTTIDKELEDIKERAKHHGEIITYLPTGETTSVNTIELDLLMASNDDLATLIGSLGADNIVLEEIPRRLRASVGPPTAPPPGEDQRESTRAMAPSVMSLPAVSGPPSEPDVSLKAVTQTVRVDIRKLDHLMNIVGELTIIRGALTRLAERLRGEGQRQLSAELYRLQRSYDRRLLDMQNGILEVRMVPLGQVFDRLARVVRQISRDASKDIRLVITGAETEIDKLIVEELSDPLMHMIRNAIDHGIEPAGERQRIGKPAAGTIALNAYQKGNHVMVEIEDDGRGIDEVGLVARAEAAGLLTPEEAAGLSRDERVALIFKPGLTTKSEAGDLSGRGVGMDVVRTNIAKLGGVIDVQSERKIGTKMTITLPITLAIVSSLLVEVAGHKYAIPLSSVSEAIAFKSTDVRVVDQRDVMTLRGSSLPLCALDRLLGLERQSPPRRQFVVVASMGARRLGLVVDHLFGQQDIIIKPLGKSLSQVRGFAGATELGDQRVGLVLDAGALIDEVLGATNPVAEVRSDSPWLTS
jgi:two-component system chemotaxis sensor kinase CheA